MTMPPSHFLKVMVQRGTITVFMPAGAIEGVPIIGPPIPIPGIAVPGRSIIIAVAISKSFPMSSAERIIAPPRPPRGLGPLHGSHSAPTARTVQEDFDLLIHLHQHDHYPSFGDESGDCADGAGRAVTMAGRKSFGDKILAK